ncbi:hypothetical protein M431DRAFT_494582 [Trichoderma harzianum CBS 226.95]|uniref:Uncharacterized protein n=1 Tax=Trichoderma harzianum CBS 226.95 TaxID=983964 RepID=A0A2T4AGD9_TRIHA|nr:hypothetical protein M431DRAFT_494582 [Trichoderma harzianum CBS 226.95]PTB56149.1 hypothetical protein M431DRAFT_494582 [Trichoderma harzianum CBS 226.95]
MQAEKGPRDCKYVTDADRWSDNAMVHPSNSVASSVSRAKGGILACCSGLMHRAVEEKKEPAELRYQRRCTAAIDSPFVFSAFCLLLGTVTIRLLPLHAAQTEHKGTRGWQRFTTAETEAQRGARMTRQQPPLLVTAGR